MKKLNKDQIKLLRLLSDAYSFANYADCSIENNEKYIDKGNYIDINNINKLDSKLVSSVCNPLSTAMRSIIGSDEIYSDWSYSTNHDVDYLINNWSEFKNLAR